MLDRGVEIVVFRNLRRIPWCEFQALEQALFAPAVLGFFQRGRRGIDRHAFGEESRGLHRHIFKFVGDHFQAVREFFQGLLVA